MKHIITILCLVFFYKLPAQRIFYTLNERYNRENLSFEILGKFKGSYLIYKNIRNAHQIAVYDAEMKTKAQVNLDFLPERLIDVICFPVGDGVIFIYQFQKKSTIYCMGAKVNAEGKLMKEPLQIDTANVLLTHGERKIYSAVMSENKKKLMVLKMRNPYKEEYVFSTRLLNSSLEWIRNANFSYIIEAGKETIGDFSLDDKGNLLFTHIPRSTIKDPVTGVNLCVLPVDGDSLMVNAISLGKFYPDEMRIKIDNYNNRYILASFYSNSRRGNIDGLAYITLGSDSVYSIQKRFFEFTDELKAIARGENSQITAFNDYYLKHFVIKKDGGVIITAESNYTNNRGMGINRWDYPGTMGWGMGSGFYGWGSPFNTWGWGMPGSINGFGAPSVRYFSENIVFFSINKDAVMEWNNVLNKTQFDDNSDDLLSYQTINTGREILLLYNEWSKRTPLLSAQKMNADGKLDRQQTLRNLDRGYEFVIRKSKQVGARELIVPVLYRNSISFARLEL